jgi:hypothetical protein
MSEGHDYQELLRNLAPEEPNSRPQPDPTVYEWEMASRVASRYRDLNVGKAAISPDEEGNPIVALELDPKFARELIDTYLIYKAGGFMVNKEAYNPPIY